MTSLIPTATTDSVTVSWTARDDCGLISGFIVTYDGVPETEFSDNTTSHTKSGLKACQNVLVAVSATYDTNKTTTSLSETIITLTAGESFEQEIDVSKQHSVQFTAKPTAS